MKIIIIGGGAAGASCATRLRRLNETAEITILERTQEVSIANCGLPYYISDVISSRDNLLVSTTQKFKNWFNIDVRLGIDVIDINKEEKYVLTSTNEKYEYDYLVLATGASPIVPEIEGMNKEKVFIIKKLADADRIKDYIVKNSVQKVAIIGGGFIGVEVAENMVEMGLDTTLIEANNQILTSLDSELVTVVQEELEMQGVKLILSDKVQKFADSNIVLCSGEKVDFDLCILAIGVKPETKLAQKTGIKFDKGILVNENLKTSDDFIYAAGDNIEVLDFVSGKNTFIPLAGPANRQGRIIADNISGLNSVYKNTQGTNVLKVFDLTVATSGNNEKQLKENGISFLKTYVFSTSHAGYYPNAKQVLFKLLFSLTGKILGVQGIGREGVEKRIDVIATIMRNNGTVQDLIDAELSYAPPYSSAKDPVNILGMSADNILKGLVRPAYFDDLDNSLIIDVRPNMVYRMGTIKGAINIPITEIRERLNEIPKDKKVVLSCNTGYTSYVASRILTQEGFNNVYSFMGGYELYKKMIKQESYSIL